MQQFATVFLRQESAVFYPDGNSQGNTTENSGKWNPEMGFKSPQSTGGNLGIKFGIPSRFHEWWSSQALCPPVLDLVLDLQVEDIVKDCFDIGLRHVGQNCDRERVLATKCDVAHAQRGGLHAPSLVFSVSPWLISPSQ